MISGCVSGYVLYLITLSVKHMSHTGADITWHSYTCSASLRNMSQGI